MPPEPFDDGFIAMVRDLDRKGALRRMRRLRDRTLIALDGTQTFSSTMIKCGNCSTGTRVKFQPMCTTSPARFRVHALHSLFMAVAAAGMREANSPDIY